MKKTQSILLTAVAGLIGLISALYIWDYFHRQRLQTSAVTLNGEVLQELFGAAGSSEQLSTHAAADLQFQPTPDLQRYGRLVQLDELSSSFSIPSLPGSGEAIMRSTSRAHLLLGTVEVDTQAVYRDGQWWFTDIVMRAGSTAQ